MEFKSLEETAENPSPDIFKNISFRLGLYILQRIISFARIIVFAHIFLPSSIGFFALLQSWMSLVTSIGNVGFRESIIRNQKKDQDLIDTVFSLTIVISCCLWVIIAISSLFVTKYVDNTSFIFSWLIISLMSFTPIGMLPVYCWERDLILKYVAIPTLISESATFLITVAIYFLMGKQIESLFIGYSLGLLISWIWVWGKSTHKFKFHINMTYIRPLFSFGFPIAIDSINGRITLSGDSVLVGNYWGAQSLGFYTNALAPFQFITSSLNIFDSITLPIFAKFNHLQVIIKKLFNYLNMTWAIIGFGMGSFIFLFADYIVRTAFGPEWETSIPLMRVLAISFAFRYVTGYAYGNLAIVRGRTPYLLKWGIVTSIFIFTVGNLLIYKYGSIGAAWFWVIQLIIFAPLVRFPLIIQELGDLKYLKLVIIPVLSGLIACGVVLIMRHFFNSTNIEIFSEIITFILIYLLSIFVFDKDVLIAINYIKNTLRNGSIGKV
jgi:O-antigen/teichoic acid export membrane protein